MERVNYLSKQAKIDLKAFFKSLPNTSTFNSAGKIRNAAKDLKTLIGLDTLKKPLQFAQKHKVVTLGAGAIALGAGDVVKEVIIDPAKQKADQIKAFKTMESKVPSLKGIDEQKKKDYFGVISLYAPSVARNPYVAGNLVNKFNEYGGPDHKIIQDIVKMEKDISGGPKGSIDKMISRAGAVIGGIV